jgi:hypothetical protein
MVFSSSGRTAAHRIHCPTRTVILELKKGPTRTQDKSRACALLQPPSSPHNTQGLPDRPPSASIWESEEKLFDEWG